MIARHAEEIKRDIVKFTRNLKYFLPVYGEMIYFTGVNDIILRSYTYGKDCFEHR